MSTHPKQATVRPVGPDGTPSTVHLPAVGFLRQHQILQFVPVSPATLWRWVRSGDFVQPVRLGANTTAWRVEDVLTWMNAQKGGSAK
jgi:predicted DNA-binding transcriptional regulator AlpA